MTPVSINIVNGRGKVYTVSGLNTILSDPYCDCPAFTYNGKCKHIQMAIEKIKEQDETTRKDDV